jgi:hypothetical protein
MGMHGVVVLHPAIHESKTRGSTRDRAGSDAVALEGLREGFGHAVALRVFDWGEARDQVERQGDLVVRRAAKIEPLSESRLGRISRGHITRRRLLKFGLVPYYEFPSVFAAARLLGCVPAVAWSAQTIASLGSAAIVVWCWGHSTEAMIRNAALAAATPLASPFFLDYDPTIVAVAMAWLVRVQQQDAARPIPRASGQACLEACTRQAQICDHS